MSWNQKEKERIRENAQSSAKGKILWEILQTQKKILEELRSN